MMFGRRRKCGLLTIKEGFISRARTSHLQYPHSTVLYALESRMKQVSSNNPQTEEI